jgi:hypothetical protein
MKKTRDQQGKARDESYLSFEDASRALGGSISPETLKRIGRAGAFPIIELNKRVHVVRLSEVRAHLDSRARTHRGVDGA